MKRLVFNTLRTFTAAALLCVASAATAQSKDDFDPFAADIEENVSTPAVPAKYSAAVASAMGNLARTLKEAGYKVEKVRSGEVVMVVIPSSTLFAPNALTLKPEAAAKLRPLVPYVKRSDKYKVVIAAHADNTGDTKYADEITAERATAVDAFFEKEIGVESQAIPYGLGFDEPVAPNTGINNRAANRRIEIYFIPTKEYIDNIKKR
ncbi:MAG: OmpA family protein [Bacteroidales bacterium]|nr:OmpA family protein [Bacteroidales bacterium]